jgi:hypothetical protein
MWTELPSDQMLRASAEAAIETWPQSEQVVCGDDKPDRRHRGHKKSTERTD